jgi:hypothetical protein
MVISYDRSVIEKEIMWANENKLLQANDTPIQQQRLAELLGE